MVVRLGKPGEVVFQVRDTGVGIPTNFRGALFQPFRQADQSLTRPKQGTGLGLSIIKHLVSRMNGSVDVESAEGEGSTFSVRLPIALTERVPSLNQEERRLDMSSKSPPPCATRRRIRIVHHDSRVEELLVQLFADHGYAPASGLAGASVSEVVRNADAVWADVESVASSELLRALLCAETGRPFPVYVVHTDSGDLAALAPQLDIARNAVLVKRPLVLHTLRDVLENPEPYMGAHIAQQASPQGHLALPVAPEVEMPVGTEEINMTSKRKELVLLVEDNLVRLFYPESVVGSAYACVQVNQRLGKRQLEKLGYDVVAVNDGQEAIEAVKKQAFHSCLMDCQVCWSFFMIPWGCSRRTLDACGRRIHGFPANTELGAGGRAQGASADHRTHGECHDCE